MSCTSIGFVPSFWLYSGFVNHYSLKHKKTQISLLLTFDNMENHIQGGPVQMRILSIAFMLKKFKLAANVKCPLFAGTVHFDVLIITN